MINETEPVDANWSGPKHSMHRMICTQSTMGTRSKKKKATILHDEMSVQDVIFKKRTHPQHMQCFFT